MLRVWSTCRSITAVSPFVNLPGRIWVFFFSLGNNDLVLIYALHILVSGNVIYSNYCIAFFMFQLHSKCPSEITKSQRLQLLVTLLCMMVLCTLRSDGATSCNVDTIRIPKWDWTNGCFVLSLLMIRLPRRVFIWSFPCSVLQEKLQSTFTETWWSSVF